MEGGPPSFTPDYSGRALLRNTTSQNTSHSPTGLSPSRAGLSRATSARFVLTVRGSYNPGTPKNAGLGSGPVRSPLLRASRLISLPPGTEMFQFPGFASGLRRMTELTPRRVSPFGHHGITVCVPLPRASRSLPRPSSPLCAQASPTCFRSLDYNSRVKQSTRDLHRCGALPRNGSSDSITSAPAPAGT